jgi:hypothetical protein
MVQRATPSIKQRILSPELKAEFIEQWNKGVPQRDMAAHFGCTRSYISVLAAQLKLRPRLVYYPA